MKTLQPETECNPEDMGGGGDCIWGPSMTSALRYIREEKQCLGARRVYTFPVLETEAGQSLRDPSVLWFCSLQGLDLYCS